MSDIVERLRDRDSIVLSGLQYAVPVMLAAADEIERLRRPSPVGRNLAETIRDAASRDESDGDPVTLHILAGELRSPQAGLGGPAKGPSDAWPTTCGDAVTVARALLAASPSPWHSMEAEGFKSMGLASTINGPCVRIDFDTTREAEKFMADLRPLLPEPPPEGEK